MNSFIAVLSLAAVALSAPQHLDHHHGSLGLAAGHVGHVGHVDHVAHVAHVDHVGHVGLHAGEKAMFSSGPVAHLHAANGAHGWADGHLNAAGRAAWTETTGTAMEGKLMPAGRAAWTHAAHLSGDAQPAVQILEQHYEQMAEPGSYLYSYKTSDGSEAMQRAALKSADAEEVQGSYAFVAPNGEKYTVNYVADDSGFHAIGDHIPGSAAIARSLEWNAAHPEEDGMWHGAEQQRASSGRAAWVSKSSANVPAWESNAKIETARFGSASGRSAWNADATTLGQSSLTTYSASAPAARAAWTDAAPKAYAGATQYTKITETKPAAFTSYSAPAARAAWTDAGVTQYTKVTETKPAFTAFSAPAARSAWTDAAPAAYTGATQYTKVTETKPAFAAYSAPAARAAWTDAGATQYTKITETKPATFTAYSAPSARAAWTDAASAAYTGATQYTKVTETKPAFAAFSAPAAYTGATQYTTVTETKPAFAAFSAPTARAAWTDAATTGFAGTGATQYTKITETKLVH